MQTNRQTYIQTTTDRETLAQSDRQKYTYKLTHGKGTRTEIYKFGNINTHRKIDNQADILKDRRTDRHMDKHKQTLGRMERQTD
jgi:hypothetical protein